MKEGGHGRREGGDIKVNGTGRDGMRSDEMGGTTIGILSGQSETIVGEKGSCGWLVGRLCMT